jgi:hypothetical protein
VAQVHVHVGRTKPKRGVGPRFVHWCDRALLGMVMSTIAFMMERAVVRGTKKKADDSEAVRVSVE